VPNYGFDGGTERDGGQKKENSESYCKGKGALNNGLLRCSEGNSFEKKKGTEMNGR